MAWNPESKTVLDSLTWNKKFYSNLTTCSFSTDKFATITSSPFFSCPGFEFLSNVYIAPMQYALSRNPDPKTFNNCPKICRSHCFTNSLHCSSHFVIRARLATPSKFRVSLAWLIKRQLCRLLNEMLL